MLTDPKNWSADGASLEGAEAIEATRLSKRSAVRKVLLEGPK